LAELDRVLDRALHEIADHAELVYQSYALHKTGRLARGVKVQEIGGTLYVTAVARNPATGYDYVGVTRWGHKGRIVPRADRAAASVIETQGKRGKGRSAALRFVIGGRVLYRRSTAGFHPTTDWAENAEPQIQAEVERIARETGRRIEALGFGRLA
jgi:hypothetical protein